MTDGQYLTLQGQRPHHQLEPLRVWRKTEAVGAGDGVGGAAALTALAHSWNLEGQVCLAVCDLYVLPQ